MADILHDIDYALQPEPGVHQYETHFFDNEGRYRDFILNVATFSDHTGKVAGSIEVMTDFTEHKGMERMKDDMAGGAAVACAMRAIAMLQAPIRVIAVVPTTENMPGGKAVKPGDVLTSAAGKTVEVINTDGEGRLVLGDGLWYARQLGATHLVDVATLTGACVVALGKITSGLYGTPNEWVEQVRRVADRAGDRSWPMPIFEEYREQLKSEIADFTNTGGRPAGSITAALFLNEFTGGLPWVHMDIAGTAWAEESKPYLPKGPTGVAVRTLAELAFSFES
jgi:leucyl aminopeptidase